MLVNRRTFIVNKPHFDEALRLMIELRHITQRLRPDVVLRVYECEYGSFDTVAFEVETESLATLEQELNDFFTNPKTADDVATLLERWLEITAPGGTNEIWRLAD